MFRRSTNAVPTDVGGPNEAAGGVLVADPAGAAAGVAVHGAGPTAAGSGRPTTVTVEFDRSDEAGLQAQIARWVGTARPRLGEVLLGLGTVDADDLLEALQHQKDAPEDEGAKAKLGEILVELGSVSDLSLATALSNQFDIPLADLSNVEIEPAAVEQLPEPLARRFRVLPMRVENGRVLLASADPLDTDAIEALTNECGRIGLMIGPRNDIDRLIDQAYSALHSTGDMIRAFELVSGPGSNSGADQTFHVDENAPLIQVVNRILTQGVRSGASDIHIQPAENAIRVRYRVDGAMTEAIRLPAAMGPAVASRLKVLAELNIVERRRPQDGQFSIRVDDRPIDVRVSVVPTVDGEKTVLRLLDKTKSLISMSQLGMLPMVEEPFLKMARSPLGMILCTGPTGAGKTTTLYAALNEVNDSTKNVITIEDPVEYQFEGVAQLQVSENGMTFADGLRGILRQDPDVILVGEIRDAETARIAMQAALTGHLVLSSLHSIDSVSAVHRFIDMGIEPFLVASALNGVVAQRLLRRLCHQCREKTTPTASETQLLAGHTDGVLPAVWFRARGCNLCNNTGYQGRVGVYELLEFSETIRELVGRRSSHAEIREQAIHQGMRSMQEQAFMLVTDGVTSIDEVLRSVYTQHNEPTTEPRALTSPPTALPQRVSPPPFAAPSPTDTPVDPT